MDNYILSTAHYLVSNRTKGQAFVILFKEFRPTLGTTQATEKARYIVEEALKLIERHIKLAETILSSEIEPRHRELDKYDFILELILPQHYRKMADLRINA